MSVPHPPRYCYLPCAGLEKPGVPLRRHPGYVCDARPGTARFSPTYQGLCAQVPSFRSPRLVPKPPSLPPGPPPCLLLSCQLPKAKAACWALPAPSWSCSFFKLPEPGFCFPMPPGHGAPLPWGVDVFFIHCILRDSLLWKDLTFKKYLPLFPTLFLSLHI